MKMISWNVNGFRACLKKGFADFFADADADAFCIQEIKMLPEEADFSPCGYYSYFFSAQKRGYSGTAVFVKNEPEAVFYGIGERHNDEGRVITLEYPSYYLVNCYTPNAQPELARIGYRMEFENDMREYLSALAEKKHVILCGDLNVAHNEIDLKHPKANIGHPGFSDQEREKMSELLASGFVDSFRLLYPDKKDAYSWWSYRANARANNVGWRIDYFIVSNNAKEKIKEAEIYADITGSDHCPVGLNIEL